MPPHAGHERGWAGSIYHAPKSVPGILTVSWTETFGRLGPQKGPQAGRHFLRRAFRQVVAAGEREAVPDLARLEKLTYLNLRSSKVSGRGITRLRKALPGCDIAY